MSLSSRIRAAVLRRFDGVDVSRVLSCWDDFAEGKKFESTLAASSPPSLPPSFSNQGLSPSFDDPFTEVVPNAQVFQSADCYVPGLFAQPFHPTSLYPWAAGLEQSCASIVEELLEYAAKQQTCAVAADQERVQPRDGSWLPPRDTAGSAYGPEWKTLGLQDRSVWNDALVSSFPRTHAALLTNNVPSCEVFFAKQAPRSGIKPHSDKNNYILTYHLGLRVPEGKCWIQVGDRKYYWKEGKSVVFDTSIFHSTENSSDDTRYVLLIRFWHPELTLDERAAFQFIFEYLDASAEGDEAVEQFEMQTLLMGTDKKKLSAKGAGAGIRNSLTEDGTNDKQPAASSMSRAERRREEKAAAKAASKSGGGMKGFASKR